MLAAAPNPITYAAESRGRGRANGLPACLSWAQAGAVCLHMGRPAALAPAPGGRRTDLIGPRPRWCSGGAEAACATNTVTSHNAAAAALASLVLLKHRTDNAAVVRVSNMTASSSNRMEIAL